MELMWLGVALIIVVGSVVAFISYLFIRSDEYKIESDITVRDMINDFKELDETDQHIVKDLVKCLVSRTRLS